MSDTGRPEPHAQGTLEKRPLAHLLAYVYERRLTGSLVFGDPDAPLGAIYLHNGEPVKFEVSAVADVWDGLADLPPSTPFAYYEAFDALGPKTIASIPALSAIMAVLRRRPPTPHITSALQRLGEAQLVLEPAVAVGSLGMGAAARDALEQLRVEPFTLEDVRAEPALRAQADILVYALLITKAVRVASGTSAAIPPPPSSSDASAPSSGEILAAQDASAPVGRVKLTRASQKLTPMKEEPTVISSYDDRASVPPPPRSKTPSPELAARRKEILDRAATIDGMNYFEMLGVSKDTSGSQVQAMFLTLAKRWHPDRLPPELRDVREPCSKVFARLSEASATLSDDAQRTRYMRLIDEGGATPRDQEKIASVIDAATNFQKAEIFMKRGDVAKAEELCALAARADPQPEYSALLAWLHAQRPENQSPEATRLLEAELTAAIQQSERCERAYFYRGMLRKRLGDMRAAVLDFRRAFELNPRNLDAQREVRVHEMRMQHERQSQRPPPAEKPSLIGRLFKK